MAIKQCGGKNKRSARNVGGPITFKAWDDTTTVHTDDYAGFIIQNSSHIRIIGFEVKGTVEHISGEVASALQFLYRVNTTNEGYSRSNYDHFKHRWHI